MLKTGQKSEHSCQDTIYVKWMGGNRINVVKLRKVSSTLFPIISVTIQKNIFFFRFRNSSIFFTSLLPEADLGLRYHQRWSSLS